MPGLQNLFRPPRARLLQEEVREGGRYEATLQIEGLLCSSQCVRRVLEALTRLEGVESVRFLRGPDLFLVEHRAGQPLGEVLTGAALRPVLFPRFREALGALGRWWRPIPMP